jgi:predicted RNA-binding Zn-ribbon protein involved in translation (DUF1610 family)
MEKQEEKAISSDFLTKNYCPSCLQFKNKEYDLISSCPDCGTTLKRKNKFFDLGGGD